MGLSATQRHPGAGRPPGALQARQDRFALPWRAARHDVLSATVRLVLRVRLVIVTLRHDVLSATVRLVLRALLVIAGGLKIHSVASMMRGVPDTRLAQRPLGNVGGVLDRPEIHEVGQRVARLDPLRGAHRRFAAVGIPRPSRPYAVPEQQPALGTVRLIQR